MNWEVRTMRSATSYFNSTLYNKTMARFWPLWTGYGVIWLFLMPLNLLSLYFNRYMDSAPDTRLFRQALDVPELVTPGLYLAAFFAVLCAMAVFGYLYNSRSACWTHALPVRRETLFTTQYLAGLSFLLLPQAAVAVLTAMVEMAFLPTDDWRQAMGALLAWLLAQSGICLFFFSFAAFCAMFTGNILALPAFYGILNVLAVVIYSLVETLMTEFFFGFAVYAGAERVVEYLSPAYALQVAVDAYRYYDSVHYFPYFNSPGTIAAYAVVGVALAAAALYVYLRRHAETAGDVVAIPLVRPLFKYGVSFCAGLCLGMFTSIFFGWGARSSLAVLIPCVLFWSAVGWFAAEMLLRKSFRVFKRWKGALVMPLVLLALCLACELDLFGVERRVPGSDEVEALHVYMQAGYPSDSGRSYDADLTDPDAIQRFLALHRAIVDGRDRLDRDSPRYQPGDDTTYITLRYTLKGGRTLFRRYDLPLYREDVNVPDSFTGQMQRLCGDRDFIAQVYGFEGFLKNGRLTGAWLENLLGPNGGHFHTEVYVDDYARELWDAVQADFAEGTIGVRYLFDYDEERLANTYYTDLCFNAMAYPDPDRNYSTVEVNTPRDYTLTVTLTPQARHTLAALEKTGVFEEGYSLAPRDASIPGGYYGYSDYLPYETYPG